MNNPKPSADCAICCSSFTKAKRAPITCKKCGFRACRECLQKYILNHESLTQIKCMIPECDCIWDRAFLAEALTQVFMRKRYPKRRGELLFQHELSRLPETMVYVERYKKAIALEEERKKVQVELSLMRRNFSRLKRTELNLGVEISTLRNNNIKNPKQNMREFIRQCPADDCRGFLSTQWKCKVCDIYVCSKCHSIKGHVLDADNPHICDKNDLASIVALKRDTKACPTCGVPINKISGCDQMWCTQCQVAFSWRTGRRVNGVVHNPHFYQWQRENGGAPRVAGDIRCGGIPRYHQIRDACFLPRSLLPRPLECYRITDGGEKPKTKAEAKTRGLEMWADMIMRLHRMITHFNRIEIRNYRLRDQDNIKRTLRINYILGLRSDMELKTTLTTLDKQQTRKHDIYHVLQLMNTIGIERLITFVQNPTLNAAKECYHECHRVRKYCNNELKKIGAIDGLSVPIIQSSFYTVTNTFSKKDVGW